MNLFPRLISRRGAALVALAIGLASGAAPVPQAGAATVTGHTRVCVYDVNHVSGLAAFASMTARKVVDCSMVYTGSPDWPGWVDPWFLHHPDPDLNWAAWVRQSPTNDRRQLIISQPLIPSGLAGTNWREAGAAGAFDGYARQLAQNLVSDGVGDAIIRLSWEANGTWNIDNVGQTPAEMAQWVAFWRNTVRAMRSVPGAHFRFDWCVNNGYRNIPLGNYYPGDDVVDIIGNDTYDSGVPPNQNRWQARYRAPDGLGDTVAFARAHYKPLSIPEWGLWSLGSPDLGGGDDPSYIDGIASVVRRNDVAYQTYFYSSAAATLLGNGSRSLAAYRTHFGDRGDAVGAGNGTAIVPATAGAARRRSRRATRSKRGVKGRLTRTPPTDPWSHTPLGRGWPAGALP